MNFYGRKYINIWIIGYLMDENNQSNFHNIYIYSGILGNFFRNFPDFSSQKNNLFEYFWDLFAILGTL